MRSLIVLGLIALIMLSSAPVVSAQMVREPGQLDARLQLRQTVANGEGAEYASGTIPKITVANVENAHSHFVNRLWIASMIAAVAGTSFDAASSWHQKEGNAFLASSDGTFGARGLSIKAAFAAAVIIPQICLRKHSELKGVFAAGNFAEAAIFGGVAIHNVRIREANSQ